MLEPFTVPGFQRGFLEVLVLAVGAGLVGTWIVLRGLAFFAHAVGTATFPGLVLAAGVGFPAALGAGVTGGLVALLVGLLARRERQDYDAVTGLVLVGALAAGIVLASDVFDSAGNVGALLFGSLLLIDDGDVLLAVVASLVALVLARLLGQRWLVTGFDPSSAPALGVRTALPDVALLGVIALLAVSALSALGSLLATALLVVPAATTRLLCTRLGVWQAATVALVAAEGVAGLWLSIQLNAPPGAGVAVLTGGVFLVVVLARGALRRAPWAPLEEAAPAVPLVAGAPR